MNIFNKIEKLHIKVNIIVLPVVFLLILSLSVVVVLSRYKTQVDFADYSLKSNVKNIETNLDIFFKERTHKLDNAIKLASDLFYSKGVIGMDSTEVPIQAINQISKEVKTVNIRPLKMNGEVLLYNFSLVDKVKELTGVTSTIFQKIPDGYLRISTNVLTKENNRAINTFIPNSSPVAQSIEKGLTYKGRAFVVSDWYLTVYEPIFLNDKIVGMLYVGVLEKDMDYLDNVIGEIKIFDKGGITLVDRVGKNIISHFDDTSSITDKPYFKSMEEKKEGVFQDEDSDGMSYLAYYKYFESYQAFIIARAYKSDYIYNPMKRVLGLILISMVLGIGLFALLFQFLIKTFTKPVREIADSLITLSMGALPKLVKVKSKDEIGLISKSTNQLIEGISKTARFAREIGKGNLSYELEVHGQDDVLGNSLLDMRSSLLNARIEEEKRKNIDNQINWATEGFARFGELLRSNHENSSEFYYSIISGLVKYVDANQGGLFIINDERDDDVYLELVGIYAYDRRKFAQKRIELGQNLVGQCFLEGEVIYMTQIPQDYVHITSGLGDANPASLILIPLKASDKIYGVIELASFNEFEDYKRNFLVKIGESIASSLSAYKINQRTAKLLRESKIQSEELAAQEEEIRQNMEELQTTQEESSRRINEMSSLIDALNSTIKLVELDFSGRILFVTEGLASYMDEQVDRLLGSDWAKFSGKGGSVSMSEVIDEVTAEGFYVGNSVLSNGVEVKENYRLVIGQDGEPLKIILVVN